MQSADLDPVFENYKVGPGNIELHHIRIASLERVTRGSWQPRLFCSSLIPRDNRQWETWFHRQNVADAVFSSRRSVRINSREQLTPPLPPSSTRSGPSNWDRSRSAKRERTVSPAPTVLSEEYYKTEEDSFYTGNEYVGSPATPQQRTSEIGFKSAFRTFARHVRSSTPLAGIFNEEESQRWVVMGRDLDAVDRLVDSQRQDAVRQLDMRRTFVNLGYFLIASFLGAVILFYMLIFFT